MAANNKAVFEYLIWQIFMKIFKAKQPSRLERSFKQRF
jgi:hypothetical protein